MQDVNLNMFSRTTFVRFLMLVAVCAVLPTSRTTATDRPNVILCMADDQGWGDTGYNGHPDLHTPHLDQMSREGVRFDRFYSAAPVCSPTRGSCLTGRHPARYGIEFANSGHMLPEEITLSEVLREHGYATGHFGKWHLGTLTTAVRDSNRGRPGDEIHYSPPWLNGFDECFSTEAKVPTWNPMLVPSGGADRGSGRRDGRVGQAYGARYWTGPELVASQNLEGDDSRIIMDRVLPFIRQAEAEKRPFLAVVWFHTPHLPTVAGGKYLEMYERFPPDKQHYYGCISAMDDQLGRLRGELSRLGVADDTMLWFCSDNGPEGGARAPGRTGGLRGRKRSLYEGGIRVPGLLVWPGRVTKPRRVKSPCSTSDYFPTVLAALGQSDLERWNRPFDGIDLLPLIDGATDQRGKPMAFESRGQHCLVDDQYKLYRRSTDHRWELYDLGTDSKETTDLAQQHPEKVEELRAQLEAWRNSCRASTAGADYEESPERVK